MHNNVITTHAHAHAQAHAALTHTRTHAHTHAHAHTHTHAHTHRVYSISIIYVYAILFQTAFYTKINTGKPTISSCNDKAHIFTYSLATKGKFKYLSLAYL